MFIIYESAITTTYAHTYGLRTVYDRKPGVGNNDVPGGMSRVWGVVGMRAGRIVIILRALCIDGAATLSGNFRNSTTETAV